MIVFPNCKINLGLSITEKRIDGFHNLETVLFPINLNDVLEIIKSPDGMFSFTQSGLTIPGDSKNNLVIKAYHLLKKEFQLPEVHIHLHKRIPMGAGLGGGSADAACAIKLLNDLFDNKLSNIEMQNFARQLGSDCAFFIQNKPVLAFDKGDIFEPVSLDLSGYHIVILKPIIHISTPDAYSMVKPSIKEKALKDIISLPIKEWKDNLHNDFEEKVFQQFPQIEKIKNKLYELGAVYSAMSGSGAAVFGIFEKEPNLKDDFSDYFIWQGKGIDV